MTIYRCTVCNYLYDEDAKDVKFADLPDSYTCPVCNASKKAFVPLKG
jgi:pyruvate oxidase